MPVAYDFQTLKSLITPGRYTDPLTPGLHLWVKTPQRRYWIFRYTLQGIRHNISLGAFPRVGIKDARLQAQKVGIGLSEGIDPRKKGIPMPGPYEPPSAPVFSTFAEEWIKTNEAGWTNKKHAHQWRYTLRDFAYPIIGHLPIDMVDEQHVLAILQPLWLTKTETASRLRGRLERIFTAAKVMRLREGNNPAAWRGYLDAVLPSPKTVKRQRGERHHTALPYRQVPLFMSQLREQGGLAALALEFLILNANRTSEVLLAEWSEITDDLWVIPARRMKAKKEHRVPLAPRSLEILQICKQISQGNRYIFSTRDRPLSNMSMAAVLKRMSVQVTVHGFRSTFRDWVAEETDHSHEVAEMALAHTISNRVEAAYRRGDLLERRRRLMEQWDDYCTSSCISNVLKIRVA